MVYLVKDLLHFKFTHYTSWTPAAVCLNDSQPKAHFDVTRYILQEDNNLMCGSSNQMVKAMIFHRFP